MDKLTVMIEKLAYGGNGVCRINGKVCFVPFSCPGDGVRLAVTAEKRSYLSANIAELVIASSHRIAPPCPLFGICGGCFWQHIDYSQQLVAKQQILGESLRRVVMPDSDITAPVLPSALPYGYRSRVQFKVQFADNRLKIGFYRFGTHRVEDLPPLGCPVALPVVNKALNRLRAVLASFREKNAIPAIKLECGEREVLAVISYTGRDTNAVERFFRERQADLSPLTGIHLQVPNSRSLLKAYGDDRVSYSLPSPVQGQQPCLITYGPGGFAQINRDQNAALLAQVRRMGCFQAHEQVLDLFCGNGNFSLPIASQAGSVTGVEESRISIESAQHNSRLNGISNTSFICDVAVGATRRWADSGRPCDTVILDPPRVGAVGLIPDICRLSPEKIIYVSCDPSTLARDCGLLVADGYSIEESVPVDMFPQTYHIESITLLRRR